MMSNDLVRRFFDEECEPHVVRVLLSEMNARSLGLTSFTFNVFNVTLDFDNSRVVIEDDLNPEGDAEVSLSEFRSELEQL
ncbi:hypothetical protein EV193_10756 [Herbihabitans rhizosphaerae]|uniref:Uncharacterized protein n=1 Tax=Herbihabitans rhizosphaerae TaxID=1872711 RepID=A0A4Q7KIY4_9PSEU|nr:hypothetical protein EV193_10756 [Herbihabitans rhizosphaerae]